MARLPIAQAATGFLGNYSKAFIVSDTAQRLERQEGIAECRYDLHVNLQNE